MLVTFYMLLPYKSADNIGAKPSQLFKQKNEGRFTTVNALSDIQFHATISRNDAKNIDKLI